MKRTFYNKIRNDQLVKDKIAVTLMAQNWLCGGGSSTMIVEEIETPNNVYVLDLGGENPLAITPQTKHQH